MNDKIALDLNPQTVSYIASLAREFQEQSSVSEGAEEDEDGWSGDDTPEAEDDPIYNELKTAIEDLEPDQQVQLVALMWLGRGSFSAKEWAGALQEAGDNWTAKSADYLIGTPLLADYLEEGLSQLEYYLEDLEV